MRSSCDTIVKLPPSRKARNPLHPPLFYDPLLTSIILVGVGVRHRINGVNGLLPKFKSASCHCPPGRCLRQQCQSRASAWCTYWDPTSFWIIESSFCLSCFSSIPSFLTIRSLSIVVKTGLMTEGLRSPVFFHSTRVTSIAGFCSVLILLVIAINTRSGLCSL